MQIKLLVLVNLSLLLLLTVTQYCNKAAVLFYLQFHTDFSGDIRFLINNTYYASQANLTLSTQPQWVECISDANPAVNCTVEVKTGQDGDSFATCSWNFANDDCSSLPCDFDCTVANSVNPSGVKARFSFIVI